MKIPDRAAAIGVRVLARDELEIVGELVEQIVLDLELVDHVEALLGRECR